MYLGTIIDPPGTAVCTYRVLGKLVIVPRLALSARRAAGATAGAAPTRGYLGRPLANLPCTGSHLFGLRRELQMCPQICWSLGSTPSQADVYRVRISPGFACAA